MTQTIQKLQTEWNQIKAQAEAIYAEYNSLRRKRGVFRLDLIFPQDHRPESLEEYRQNCQQEIAKWHFDLQELDQELKSTRLRLKKVRAQLIVKQTKLYELQAQQQWPKVCEQAEIVNQLTQQLEQEIRTLWKLAHDFQPRIGSWLPEHPQLVEFSEATFVPTVTSQEDCLAVQNQAVDWQQEP
ncbi:MAG: hypothetical protein ACRC8A_00075 [Microcoleaceae cyanobacterium]